MQRDLELYRGILQRLAAQKAEVRRKITPETVHYLDYIDELELQMECYAALLRGAAATK